MRLKYIILITSLFFLANYSNGQSLSTENGAKIERANEIVKQAREAIYRNIKRADVKAIHFQTNGTTLMESATQIDDSKEPKETKLRQILETDLSVELPGNVKQEIFSYDPDKNPTENYVKSKNLIYGERFSAITDTIVNGKAFDLTTLFNSPFMPETLKKQMKDAQEKIKPTKEGIQTIISNSLFTVLLSSLWGDDKTFNYVGKAEASDSGRADVLEIVSDTNRQTRYFFDEKTHLLLMITEEISKNGLSAKTTQYFSDYQLMDGLLVAKKINVESESSAGSQEMEIMGKKVKISSKSKTISETTVKEFKINPSFKAETFAIKEEKK